MDLIVRNARLPDAPDRTVDIGIKAGRIAVIEAALAAEGEELDVGGRLVSPGFVETHIHLDKSCILDRCQSVRGDLPEAETLVMAVTQKAPIGSTFGDNVTAPAWKAKPSWYQISANDRMIHPDNQAMMSSRMGAKKVITLDASHASLASHPAEVAGLIVEAAES